MIIIFVIIKKRYFKELKLYIFDKIKKLFKIKKKRNNLQNNLLIIGNLYNNYKRKLFFIVYYFIYE